MYCVLFNSESQKDACFQPSIIQIEPTQVSSLNCTPQKRQNHKPSVKTNTVHTVGSSRWNDGTAPIIYAIMKGIIVRGNEHTELQILKGFEQNICNIKCKYKHVLCKQYTTIRVIYQLILNFNNSV